VTVKGTLPALAREPLRHIVLLKQLHAGCPRHVGQCRCCQAYPKAALAAFIASAHPDLTSLLLQHVPRGAGIVFKLAIEADLAAVQAHFADAFNTFEKSGLAASSRVEKPD
jgi:hypothetical protein